MKVAFFLDVKLRKKDEIYYTTGAADYKYFNNHRISKENDLVIFCRNETKSNNNNLAKSSGENIDIVTINGYIDLLNKKNRNTIENIIDKSDIHIVKMPTIIGIYACHLLRKKKKKYIVEMVGDPYKSLRYKGGIIPKILAPISYIINKYYIKRATIVTYVSNEYLQTRYPTRGQKFSISDVIIKDFNEDILNKRLEKIEKQKTNEIKIGLIGSLDVNYKGHSTAIKAIKILQKKYKKIELHFLGNGNKEKWEKIIKKNEIDKNVFFNGVIPHEEIYNWLDNIDIFIIPSLTEGMPRSLIEAMSRGCLCIGTNVGGIPELLDKEMLIKKNDYVQLAKIIERKISNKEDMKKIALHNMKIAQNYEENKIKDKRDKYNKTIRKEFEEKM